MEQVLNVFTSEVPIKRFKSEELYELLETSTVLPIQQNKPNTENRTTFSNATGKSYVSRKICKKKVRTVRQIRKEYEQYVLGYLPTELEMQHRYLLDKIRRGFYREEMIIEKARKLLRSSNAMKRSSWQMLININADNVRHPKQYVIWKGKSIKVSGSKGGSKKVLYNFDVTPKSKTGKSKFKKSELLKTSLDLTFKPGPLTKKEYLDTSFQKFTLGKTELMPLPKVALEIITVSGVPLHPSLNNFLQNCREINGTLTEDWIKFAVSSLENNSKECVVTFKLNYKNNQKRILMRNNNGPASKRVKTQKETITTGIIPSEEVNGDLKSILDDILRAVEVSIMQDTIIIDEELGVDTIEVEEEITHQEIPRKNRNIELKKLDVTIIHVEENPMTNNSTCSKKYCVMGCVCQSLQCKPILKSHCGQIKCMFDCKCDHQKFFVNNHVFDGCITGFMNVDKKLNGNLATEEKKFRQTVLFTKGNGIVLSSKRRNPRMTKKYSDYLYSLTGNPHQLDKEILISLPKLPCSNIEPWCMVHELYRCFCHGRFVVNHSDNDAQNNTLSEIQFDCDYSVSNEMVISNIDKNNATKVHSESLGESADEDLIDVVSEEVALTKFLGINPNPQRYTPSVSITLLESENFQQNEINTNSTCARTRPFSCQSDVQKETTVLRNEQIQSEESFNNLDFLRNSREFLQQSQDNTMFANWLEQHYKQIKDRMDSGLPITLEKPTPSRMSLFPWPDLLKRYVLKINHFLVNKTAPHRMFISVNTSHQEFNNCVNLRDVSSEDLHRHPDFVRHFIMKTDLQNNFALLHGANNYWEVLGIVAKNKPVVTPPQTPINEETSLTHNKKDAQEIASDTTLFEISDSTLPPSASSNKVLVSIAADSVQPKASRRLRSIKARSKQSGSQIVPQSSSSIENASKNHNKIKSGTLDTRPSILTRTNKFWTKLKKARFGRKIMQQYPHHLKKKSLNPRKEEEATVEPQKDSSPDECFTTNDHVNSETVADDYSNCRWFVMTVENDFTHLQFIKQKLFVTFETIMKAVNLARSEDQTIVLPLTKLKGNNTTSDIQFGIYATPVIDEANVLIGPYEKNEELCMETVRNVNCPPSYKKTRGVWLITKKVENSDVVENPISYLSLCSTKYIKNKTGNSNNVLEILDIPNNNTAVAVSNCLDQKSENGNDEIDETVMEDIEEKIFSSKIQKSPLLKPNLHTDYGNGDINKCVEAIKNSVNIQTILHCQELIEDTLKLKENPKIPENFTAHSKYVHPNPTEPAVPKVSTFKVAEEEQDQKKTNANLHVTPEKTDLNPFFNHGGVILRADVVDTTPKTSKVKPIRIRRNNGLYQLPANSFLNSVSLLKPIQSNSVKAESTVTPTSAFTIAPQYPPLTPCLPVITKIDSLAPKPDVVKPKVKMDGSVHFSSISNHLLDVESVKNQTCEGQFKKFTVLKPDQINTKALKFERVNFTLNKQLKEKHVMEGGLEEVMAGPSSNSNEVYILSDDETPNIQPKEVKSDEVTDVLIKCINITGLGCLLGRKNSQNNISFQFPSFKYTDYCTEDEASTKINQVLSRKVFVPKSLIPLWRVISTDSSSQTLLDTRKLGPNYVLTKYGLVHKDSLKIPRLQHTRGSQRKGQEDIITLEVDEENSVT